MDIKNFLKDLFNDRITYDDLSEIREDLDFEDQEFSFEEDLLQVDSICGQYLLDVGWYPSCDKNGCFRLVIIKKYDWDAPVYTIRVKDIPSLKKALKHCKEAYNF